MPWHSPWFGSITLTTANTAYQLTTQLRAKDAAQFTPQEVIRFLWLTIQVDKTAGAANVYIGNSNVSPTEYGWNLVATQSVSIPSSESNLLIANDTWFLSDTDNVILHLGFLTR